MVWILERLRLDPTVRFWLHAFVRMPSQSRRVAPWGHPRVAGFYAVSRDMSSPSPSILPSDSTAWPIFSVSNLHLLFSNSVALGLGEDAWLKPLHQLCCFPGILSFRPFPLMKWEDRALCLSHLFQDILEQTQTHTAFISFRKFGRPVEICLKGQWGGAKTWTHQVKEETSTETY